MAVIFAENWSEPCDMEARIAKVQPVSYVSAVYFGSQTSV